MWIPHGLRRFSDPIMERVPVPIVGGVNRGRWWNLASAGSGYASGRFDAPRMRLLQALIAPGDVVWDVGAHHGYVTLCAAARVGSAGRVHAFEPSARNCRILLRHVAWNRLLNVSVHPWALSSFDGQAAFGGGRTSRMHALGGGDERVAVRTAASLVTNSECTAPTFVKVDIEGAEGDFIAGFGAALRRAAQLLVAMHSPEADRQCSALLLERGFELVPSRELVDARRGPWRGDPDLCCLGPHYAGREDRRALLHELGFC